MFGHDDKQKHDEHQDEAVASTAADQALDSDNQDGQTDSDWQHPGPPPSDDDDTDKQTDQTDDFSVGKDGGDTGESLDKPDNKPAFSSDTDPAGPSTKHDLIDIKQEALGKLTPLIGHLDQTPDEKFRTLMMMIQASDDQSLVRQAYETALEIGDEKTRAQALLDIVNEINYFTQNPAKSE